MPNPAKRVKPSVKIPLGLGIGLVLGLLLLGSIAVYHVSDGKRGPVPSSNDHAANLDQADLAQSKDKVHAQWVKEMERLEATNPITWHMLRAKSDPRSTYQMRCLASISEEFPADFERMRGSIFSIAIYDKDFGHPYCTVFGVKLLDMEIPLDSNSDRAS